MIPTAAEKLLAMLEDGQTIEALAADEVRDDLALLGLDPAPAIAFAHALAAGHGTPGGRLLGGIDAAEDAEDEIARIESADIDAVRAQIPGGSAAAIAAEARRKAGGASNVVGIQRRRRRLALIWGAPAASIAASLLVVVVGYEVLKVSFLEMQMQSVQSAAPSSTAKSKAAPSIAESEALPSAGFSEPRDAQPELLSRQNSASEAGESDDAVMAKRARREANAPPPPAVALGNEARGALADDMAPLDVEDADKADNAENADRGFFRAAPESTTDSVAQNREQKPEEKSIAGAGRSMTDSGDTAVGLLAEPALPERERPAESFAAKSFADKPRADKPRADTSVAASRVVAVLVVDEALAPASIGSQGLPEGVLADRLDEARRVAAGRDVVALIALETSTGQTDFVQVPVPPGMPQQLAPPSPIAGLLGVDAAAYDFIALPRP